MVNRRRAPSSQTSSLKKRIGHKVEEVFAKLIDGKVIKGSQKGDVSNSDGKLFSVKNGKKWQVFLYSYNRILKSLYLKVLTPCLDAFPEDWDLYNSDRTKCKEFKENYVLENGKDAAKSLLNEQLGSILGQNQYMEAKELLSYATEDVYRALSCKVTLYNFLKEAFFNNEEVDYLAVKDTHYKKDNVFKVFDKEDVLKALTANLYPALSVAGRAADDYNVAGQKTLLKYNKSGKPKNIIEIEIRNDDRSKYRQVRFNTYSEDILFLLLNEYKPRKLNENLVVFGSASKCFRSPE